MTQSDPVRHVGARLRQGERAMVSPHARRWPLSGHDLWRARRHAEVYDCGGAGGGRLRLPRHAVAHRRSCEDSWVIASALAPMTERLRFLVAVRPGLQSPTLAARMTAALDRLSDGRLLINVVVGGDPDGESRQRHVRDPRRSLPRR